MRILIACDGSKIGESPAIAIGAWPAEMADDVHLFSVVDPGDLHGVWQSKHASSLFLGPSTAQTLVVPSPGRAAEIPAQGGEMAAEFTAGSASHSVPLEDKGQAGERARAEHYDYLRAVATTYFAGRDVGAEIAFSNDAADAIARQAEAIGAQLIAVGTHGRSGLSRALMGSVAEKLVREARVPVMVVGPAAQDAMGAAANP